jgi:hypothetical protein
MDLPAFRSPPFINDFLIKMALGYFWRIIYMRCVQQKPLGKTMATIKVPREVYALVEKSLVSAREQVESLAQKMKEAAERHEAAKKQVAEIEVSLKQMEPSQIDIPLPTTPRRGRPRKVA